MNPKPQSTVYVAYVIPNPAEVATFYPQAVVKNTQTGVIVATINLVQDSNNILRYTGSFMSPADSTGNGYYLDVITIPYTDSGHTTPSQNYWAATNQYFVSQSIAGSANYGGGYMDFDPKKLRKLFQEELAEFKPIVNKTIIPAFPEIPVPEKVDFGPTNESIGQILAEMRSFRRFVENLPTFKETDLSSVSASVEKANKDAAHRIESSVAALIATGNLFPEKAANEIRAAISGVIKIFEAKFSELVEKGIPIRSPIFQEDKPRLKAPGISDMMKELSAVKR